MEGTCGMDETFHPYALAPAAHSHASPPQGTQLPVNW